MAKRPTDDDIVRPASRRSIWSLPRFGGAKVIGWSGCDFPDSRTTPTRQNLDVTLPPYVPSLTFYQLISWGLCDNSYSWTTRNHRYKPSGKTTSYYLVININPNVGLAIHRLGNPARPSESSDDARFPIPIVLIDPLTSDTQSIHLVHA